MADVMSKLGTHLKETRETLGYSYEKVTQDIRLSEDIIKQLEDGGFAELPSYNHAKNFVKNYAEYLGLDADDTQNMLQEECTRADFTKDPEIVVIPLDQAKEEIEPASITKYILPVVVVILVIFAGTKLFLSVKVDKSAPAPVVAEETQKQEQEQQQQTPDVQPPAEDDTTFNTVDPQTVEKTIEEVNSAEEKAQAEASAANPTETVKPEDAAKTDAAAATVDKKDDKNKDKAAKTGNVATLNFADVCWVHVKSDTGEELDFIASRGNHREIAFKKYFILDVGNAAVASVTYNGRVISGLGGYKQPAKGLKFEPNESGVLKYSIVK